MIATDMSCRIAKEEAGRQGPAGSGKKWLTLFGWLALLWFFIFIAAPWLQSKNAFMRQLGNYIEASGIDAGAIYYTEVEEVGEADLAIRNTFRFYLDEQEEK